ncbi:MAG: hypothetical protein U9R72_12930 [Chloroflexota bacterium]|nr:hypothetical protein [Chloroflexota bacterium]
MIGLAITLFSGIRIRGVLFNLLLLRLGYGPEFVGLVSGLGVLTYAVACLLLAGPVLAQVSANDGLSWHVVAGGTGRIESAGHTMWGTMGQFASGPMASTDHTLCGGFWCLPSHHRIYLPLILRGA